MPGPVISQPRIRQVMSHLSRSAEERGRAQSLAHLVYRGPDDPMRAAWDHVNTSLLFMQMAVEILLSECERYD
jgi:hypothetical protein